MKQEGGHKVRVYRQQYKGKTCSLLKHLSHAVTKAQALMPVAVVISVF